MQELTFLCSARRLMLIDICMKFREDSFRGFQVTERTRFMPDRRTPGEKQYVSQPFGGRHNSTNGPIFPTIVQKPAQDIKLEKQFRSTPSTEKVWWLYVEDDTIGKHSGSGVKSECGFFILKFKMVSKMAAKK